MGVFTQVAKLVDEGAKRIKAYHGSPHDSANFNPQLAGRHPSDNADMSALQLAPYMAKGLVNDVVKYGSQAVTGEISDGDFLQQQPLTGQAKTIADAAGSAMGTALNYKVPSLMQGPRSVMDDLSMVADGYRKVKPSLVNAFGESNVNRGEGAGLLGSMFIPAKIPKSQSGGLFSQAAIASDKLQRKTGNADGFFNDLTGKGQVKPDELNAMGFKENFAGRNDVSRQEVQQFINENQVQIKETLLSNAEGYRRGTKFGDYTLEGGDNYRELLLQDNSSAGLLDELNLLNKQIGEMKTPLLRNVTSDDALKKRYSDATIFGDMEIDEFVANEIPEYASLISRRDELVKQKDSLPEPFVNSSHFDEPNILAHLRMKDRVDTDGNKTLLIEEAQSDWHQKGGEYGYQTPELKRQLDDVNTELQAAKFKYSEYDDQKMLEELGFEELFSSDPMKPDFVEQSLLATRIDELGNMQANLESKLRDAVPDAPFKTDDKSSWYNLAMKRGLLEAVEGGYDKLALTTGRQQADRYDLSKQINEVRLGGDEQNGFTVSAFDKNDSPVIMQSIDSLDALPNLIGKDAAKSLVDQPLTDTTSGSARILAGQDLSVGGEGMKQFYDRTLPNALGKLVKQDGVKVGQSELSSPRLKKMLSRKDQEELTRLKKEFRTPAGLSARQLDRYTELNKKNNMQVFDKDTVHSIDITPEMRERVKKGLPLFATGGAAIGLGELMRQQQQERESRNGALHSL